MLRHVLHRHRAPLVRAGWPKCCELFVMRICDACNDSPNFLSQSSALREGSRRDHRMTNACVSAGWVGRRRKVQIEQRKEFVRWTIFLIFSIIAPKVAQGVASNAVSPPAAGTSEWLASFLFDQIKCCLRSCGNICILHMYVSNVDVHITYSCSK
jgi:hypothetical protein